MLHRERSTDAYDTLSYFTAKFFTEMPLNVLPCILFTCILYWMTGLNPYSFGFHILILMYENLCAISIGLLISAMVPNVEVANALGPIVIVVFLLFSGFYSKSGTLLTKIIQIEG